VVDVAEVVSGLLDDEVVSASSVRGGDVADAYRVTTVGRGVVFAKLHHSAPPGFFVTEASGLAWLGAAGAVAVPEVLAVSDDPAVLVLEWIEPGRPTAATETALGEGLAALHGAGAPSFGREDRRTTGSRGLPNEPFPTWAEAYAANRLLPLARLTADAGALPDHAVSALEEVAGRLAELGGPEEPPARLHGDLWGGNRLIGAGGVNWLIDPAAHGGHREFDLAMMRLFGGFGEEAHVAYQAVAPLADGWAGRIPLHQLAPLAVHALKFGGAYVAATQRALDAVRAV
jgi:fructosamine-3-kinase